MKPERSRYFKIGLTLFTSALAVILVYALIFKGTEIRAAFSKITVSLAPLLWGIFIAYLLWHVIRWVQGYLDKWIRIKNERVKRRLCRALSIIVSLIFFLAVIVLLFSMILPAVWEALKTFVGSLSEYETKAHEYIDLLLKGVPWLSNFIGESTDVIFDKISEFITNGITANIEKIISTVSSSVISFGKGLLNFLIGIIISVYILASKEIFAMQAKKILFSLFKEENAMLIIGRMKRSQKIFDGFVTGKLLDSFIIGVLCFIGLTILRIPYAVLISVLVGVTNVIPIAGPFIGAIPSAFILLLVDPIKALIFVVFIIVLQQLDGNLIGPKILGDGVGLSAFWIIVALLVGGSMFGIVGMFFAVPVFAIIYDLIRDLINRKLEKREIPIHGPYPDQKERFEAYKRQQQLETDAQEQMKNAPYLGKPEDVDFWEREEVGGSYGAGESEEPPEDAGPVNEESVSEERK